MIHLSTTTWKPNQNGLKLVDDTRGFTITKLSPLTLQCDGHMSTMKPQITSHYYLFHGLLKLNKRDMKALHYWPFARGIHQWVVDCPHNEAVIQKTCLCHDIVMTLTHLPLDKMAAFLQTICSWRSSWQQSSTGSDNGLAPNRWQAIIWTNADLIHWCIYVALGGEELIDDGVGSSSL